MHELSTVTRTPSRPQSFTSSPAISPQSAGAATLSPTTTTNLFNLCRQAYRASSSRYRSALPPTNSSRVRFTFPPTLYINHHHPPHLPLSFPHLQLRLRASLSSHGEPEIANRRADDDDGGGGPGGGAAGGVDPVGAAGARGGAQRRRRGGGAAHTGRGGAGGGGGSTKRPQGVDDDGEEEEGGVGVPGADEAGHLRRRLPGAHLPVRRLQPLVLRGGLHLPRPLPAPPPGPRRRLLQRPPPPHHLRPHRRQVRRRHMLQQRLLREGGRDQPDGDELPGGGLPLRHRLRPQRHARRLRLLLRRAADRDGVPRAPAAVHRRRLPHQLAAALLDRPGGRRRRHRGRRHQGRLPPTPAAAHRLTVRALPLSLFFLSLRCQLSWALFFFPFLFSLPFLVHRCWLVRTDFAIVGRIDHEWKNGSD